MSITACAALAVLASWYLLKPIFSDANFVTESNETAKLNLLNDQKDRSVHMLRDLELDYTTGKLSDEEYKDIKDELSLELSDIISKIDRK